MARLQSLQQQHSLERSFAPTSSKMITGMSGTSEGVPRSSLKISSMKAPSLKLKGAAMKASSLIHGLRLKKFHMPSLKMAKFSKMPKLH